MHYDVPKHSRKCHATGRDLRPGESFYSVLVETSVGQERWDFSAESWTGPPENSIGFWKGRLAEEPAGASQRRELPVETMVDLFDGLSGMDGDEERRVRLRYMLGLMLVRKRALKLHNLRRDGDRQWLVVRRPASGELVELADPCLSEEQTQALEDELHDWMDEAVRQG